METETVRIKRDHLKGRQEKRDKDTPSILPHFGNELDDEQQTVSRCSDVDIQMEDKPDKCSNCNGRGWVKGLFENWECSVCFGTTYDLSNPIAVIKWQKLCMEWAKKDVIDSRYKLKQMTTTPEERQEGAVHEFYSGSKRKD